MLTCCCSEVCAKQIKKGNHVWLGSGGGKCDPQTSGCSPRQTSLMFPNLLTLLMRSLLDYIFASRICRYQIPVYIAFSRLKTARRSLVHCRLIGNHNFFDATDLDLRPPADVGYLLQGSDIDLPIKSLTLTKPGVHGRIT
jgi:hypothetical protein